jgi:hypothetical protein
MEFNEMSSNKDRLKYILLKPFDMRTTIECNEIYNYIKVYLRLKIGHYFSS